MSLKPHSAARTLLGVSFATAFTLILSGCGLGAAGSGNPVSASAAISSTGIAGSVHGGRQPISGATVQLYEVGATGYTTGLAKPILTTAVTTNSTGGFSITGDYTCDAGSYVYITASGGNPGSGANNPNITLMAALGSCSYLKANAATTFLNINEVTTVAGAYALAQFFGGSSFGTPLSSQPGIAGASAPADNFTTSSTNVQGIANAMALAQVIASNATGASPGNNANGTATVEYWQVNTLADILAGCVNSQGLADSSNTSCATLFSNVNAPTGAQAPADTLQAAVAMALNPTLTATKIANLYGIITAVGTPFLPDATAATKVYDLSLAVAYNPASNNGSSAAGTANLSGGGVGSVTITNGGSGYTTAPAVVFTGGTGSGAAGTATVSGGTVTGVNMTAAGSYTVAPSVVFTSQILAQPTQIAFDSYGNAWVANHPTSALNNAANPTGSLNDFVVELDPMGDPIPAGSAGTYQTTGYSVGGTATTLAGFASSTTFPFFSVTVDTNNNVWLADKTNSNVVKIPGSGAVVTSSGIATTSNGGSAGAVGYPLSNTTGTPAVTAGIAPEYIAIDGANDVYIATASGTQTNTCTTAAATGGFSGSGKGLVTFVGGSPTNVNYGRFSATENAPILVDGGTAKFTSNGNLIPGQPFVWGLGYNLGGTNTSTGAYTGLVWQSYGGSNGANALGCYTPDSYDGVSTTASGIASTLDTTATTALPGTLGTSNVTVVPAINGSAAAYVIGSDYGLALDGSGDVWLSNTSYVDSTSATPGSGAHGTLSNSITKITPSYSAALTPADAAANWAYTIYHDLGGQSTGSTAVQARLLTTDGASNVWFTFSTGASTVGAINSSTNAAISPNYGVTGAPGAGFFGSACPSTCYFTGTTTSYQRYNGAKQPVVDSSGNVWLPMNGTALYPKIVELVGPAVPLAAPASLAIANGKFGQKP
ncbi:hypothetical protein SAMN05421770_1083 [Granulicella rosea]|uniref:Uncharacterized protein n=1 Tax=Granulicella rosea TaxID=474952 RepID=A0A239LXN6_9BACT|nr:hypothetical protein [Granulicella rosea]SNT34404.1 hypothetical protein SAMN05421770_1083 [Granulicella rosea]